MEAAKWNNVPSDGDNDHNETLSWFKDISKNASFVQTETLRRILELNYGVEYLQKWLGDHTKVKEVLELDDAPALESLYTSLVPLATHVDFEPYIQRIADGDTSPLLTQQPITSLSISSGTTGGRQKHLPFTRTWFQNGVQIFKLASAFRSREFPIKGGRVLDFIYGSKDMKSTKGGLTVATPSMLYYSNQETRAKKEKTNSSSSSKCSPDEVNFSGDYNQSTYCHLLLGLYFSDEVYFVNSVFAYSLVQAFSSFEELWREIYKDIKGGTLSIARVKLPKLREAVLNQISPNASLASRIEACCKELESSDWFGLIPKLWPNAKYVVSIMSGAMQQYVKKLRHYAGDLPLVGSVYGASEGWIGVNVDPMLPPEDVTFTVVPTFGYFEFIPHARPKQGQNLVNGDFIEDKPTPLSKVKVGHEYEIVLTTFTGLYRYKLGDVVKVAGFHNGTPKLKYIGRKNLILTVNIDKNTEQDLQIAVERGSELLTKGGAELVDFISHADTVSQPGHYVIFWEIKGEVEERVLGECCKELDLSFKDYGYVTSRTAHTIGPLELCIVETGTFKKLVNYSLENGATLNQFKIPRCTNNLAYVRILKGSTVKMFYSTAYD